MQLGEMVGGLMEMGEMYMPDDHLDELSVKLYPSTTYSSSNMKAVIYYIKCLCKIGRTTAVGNAQTTQYPDDEMTVIIDLLKKSCRCERTHS